MQFEESWKQMNKDGFFQAQYFLLPFFVTFCMCWIFTNTQKMIRIWYEWVKKIVVVLDKKGWTNTFFTNGGLHYSAAVEVRKGRSLLIKYL